MTDREKVIKGLELCKQDAKLCFSETECPYQCEFPRCCLKLMADALELLKEQGWISVEERFPEEPFGCLVTIWDSKPNGGDDFPNILPYFVGWDGEQWNDSDGVRCSFEVIAWMKLPEPYQPKD